LQRLLLHFAAEDFRRVLPAWTNEFYRRGRQCRWSLGRHPACLRKRRHERAAGCAVLGVHPKYGLRADCNRIFDIRGLQARSYDALTDLLMRLQLQSSVARLAPTQAAPRLNILGKATKRETTHARPRLIWGRSVEGAGANNGGPCHPDIDFAGLEGRAGYVHRDGRPTLSANVFAVLVAQPQRECRPLNTRIDAVTLDRGAVSSRST